MTLDMLAQLGEFVGGFFVVVSLVYLAYQVRQNTRSIKAENYARVLNRMSEMQSRLALDADLNHIVVVGAEDPGRLTHAERVRFAWALYELIGTAEFVYHQFRDGTLSETVWLRWRKTLGWWLSHPGMRAWWRAKPTPFSADFEALADEFIRDNQFDAAAIARWRAFVAGDDLEVVGLAG